MRIRWMFGSLILSLALVSTTLAAVPHLVRYQGTAVDSKGVPLEGPYDLTFRLYNAATAGTKVWQETQPAIQLTTGHFSVLLGQVTPLNVDWSVPLWLSVQVGTDPELAPRQQITSVPLAIRAELADQAVQLTQPIMPSLITPQGSGSGLDADSVDGKHANDFLSPSNPAGGDLSGTYPNPTIAKLQGRAVQNAPPSDKQVLTWVAASGRWEPKTLSENYTELVFWFNAINRNPMGGSEIVFVEFPGWIKSAGGSSSPRLAYEWEAHQGSSSTPPNQVRIYADSIVLADVDIGVTTYTQFKGGIDLSSLPDGTYTLKLVARAPGQGNVQDYIKNISLTQYRHALP